MAKRAMWTTGPVEFDMVETLYGIGYRFKEVPRPGLRRPFTRATSDGTLRFQCRNPFVQRQLPRQHVLNQELDTRA
jgi:hypothetical protein